MFGALSGAAAIDPDADEVIDTRRPRGYNGGVMLRRAAVLASLIVYLGVGVCRQACALDLPVSRPNGAVPASGCVRCREKSRASSDSSRRAPAPCCVLGAQDASVLLPAPAAILPARDFSAAFVFAAPPATIGDASAPSVLAARAPPAAAASALPRALHGPRPPPSCLAVL